MILSDGLINNGFSLQDVNENDLESYINIRRDCLKKYVDDYNGGWMEEIQVIIGTDNFHKMQTYTCFQKVLQNHRIVGFFTFAEQADRFGSIALQLMKSVRHMGLEAFYISCITSLSREADKPVFLHLYKSDPIQGLYKQFGFIIYDQSRTHYLMSFNQNAAVGINTADGFKNHGNHICGNFNLCGGVSRISMH